MNYKRIWVAGHARNVVVLGAAALLAAYAAAAETKPAPAAKYYFRETADQAKVVAATFVGGKGHEWLVSGGWRKDGSVILVGNVLGPTLSLGAAADVIGADASAPAAPAAPDVKLGDRARPFVIWNLPGVTGFLVKCAPDLKKIVSVHRLPWTAGVITAAAVDSSGAVYVAGMATDKIELLGGKQEKATAGTPDDKHPSCETFLAKVSSDLKRCDWIHRVSGPSNPPQLRLLPDGMLWLLAQDVRVLDASGKVLRSAALPAGIGSQFAVSTVDGTFARGANRGNWSTGREPWKCPGIRVVRPDGADLYHLYEWDGRYVGLDNHRSVADTTVSAMTYDYAGNLLFYTWSDGGNEVMRYRSTDIRRPHGCRGLGFHWGGTGYNVVKLEGRDYQTVGSTKWRTETERGRGLMRMSTLVAMSDGAVCIAGSGGDRGVHETTGTLMPDGATGGNYVTVLSGDLSTALFGSMVGGAGEVGIGQGAWGAVSGVVDGRRKCLLLTGAKEMNEVNVLAAASDKTPTRNAMQSAFGGGAVDGYAILLDVPSAPPAGGESANLPAKFQRLAVESAAPTRKEAGDLTAEDTVVEFVDSYPKFVTADAEFRHAADEQVLYGPTRGEPPCSQPVVKDGVSFSVRPSRPVFGLGEELSFDLLMASVGGEAVRLPAMKWEMMFADTWRCRADGDAAGIRIAADAFERISTEGKAPSRLPLGTYRVHFRLQPAGAGGEIVTGPVEFRVWPYWPNFMYGRSVSGQMTWQDGKLVGAATVRCPTWVQVNGDQGRRVLGELVQGKAADALPGVVFTISELGEMKEQEVRRVGGQGKAENRWVRYSEGKGKLEFAGRSVDVRAKCVLRMQTSMPDNGVPGLAMDAYFTVKGRDLGLKRLADDEIDVRIGMRGTFPKRGPDPAKAMSKP